MAQTLGKREKEILLFEALRKYGLDGDKERNSPFGSAVAEASPSVKAQARRRLVEKGLVVRSSRYSRKLLLTLDGEREVHTIANKHGALIRAAYMAGTLNAQT